jgi:hypothetical protein
MRDMMTKLKLTVNETKTRACKLPEENFDFLGYTFGRCYSTTTGRAYLGTTPSKKRVQRICEAISDTTRRSQTQQGAEALVQELNRRIVGWAIYFCLGPVSKAYRAAEAHTRRRFRRWLCAKHKRQGLGRKAISRRVTAREVWTSPAHHQDRQLSVGNPVNLSPRAGCVKHARPVR